MDSANHFFSFEISIRSSRYSSRWFQGMTVAFAAYLRLFRVLLITDSRRWSVQWLGGKSRFPKRQLASPSLVR